MIRILGLIFGLPAAIAGLLVANNTGIFGFFATLGAVALIVGFAIVATGSAIRCDV